MLLSGFSCCCTGIFGVFPPIRLGPATEIKCTVVVGFARTGDGNNHWPGTTFARADICKEGNRGRYSQGAVVLVVPEVFLSPLTQPGLARPRGTCETRALFLIITLITFSYRLLLGQNLRRGMTRPWIIPAF